MAAVLAGLLVVRAGTAAVNGRYEIMRDATLIPRGFTLTCQAMGWEPVGMWRRLSDQTTPWYLHENGSYIYWNQGDGQWWIDEPSGAGVYVSKGHAAEAAVAAAGRGATTTPVPPADGWRLLQGAKGPAPTVEWAFA